jgi:hypothetical protein
LAYAIERFAQMTHDVELVEQDRGLRRLVPGDVAERLPHVHHGKPDLAALFEPQPGIELRHAGLGAVLAAEPDRPLADEVADHDAVAVTPADGDFVDADRPGPRRAGAGASRARMYCISSVLTVSQSSFSSRATSRIAACEQRRPT